MSCHWGTHVVTCPKVWSSLVTTSPKRCRTIIRIRKLVISTSKSGFCENSTEGVIAEITSASVLQFCFKTCLCTTVTPLRAPYELARTMSQGSLFLEDSSYNETALIWSSWFCKPKTQVLQKQKKFTYFTTVQSMPCSGQKFCWEPWTLKVWQDFKVVNTTASPKVWRQTGNNTRLQK